MAGPGYSSPFPTSHDTIGASTLVTPADMPSSPPKPIQVSQESTEPSRKPVSGRVAAGNAVSRRRDRSRSSSRSSRSSSMDSDGHDLDARLADYTIDFSKFPSGQFGLDEKDDDPLPDVDTQKEEDKLSEIGGPEDFTVNMEKYLWGDGTFSRNNEDGDNQKRESVRSQAPLQAVVEDEAELGEYSEFGPPVDMSTPSHLLWRNNNSAKDGTHLEGIDESPPGSPATAITPSVRRQKDTAGEDNGSDDLRRQIEHLQEELQDRDDQIQANRKRVLQAASAGEQIKHLQTELGRTTALLKEMHAKRGDEALLREQVQLLQKQNDEKDVSTQNSKSDKLRLEALEQHVETLQAELKRRDESAGANEESWKTVGSLQEKLQTAQEQVNKRDEALEESISKLNKVTATKDLQIQQKNTEIEDLKAQISDQLLEIEKLEEDMDAANDEYETLEGRVLSLENRNRPLEEKNITLEADLERVQSQVTIQEKALKTVAVDLFIHTEQKTFTEILDSIKATYRTKMASSPESLSKEANMQEEINDLRKQLAKSQQESKEIVSAKEALEVELKRSEERESESQGLITTIEAENSRLSSRVDELTTNLNKLQSEWDDIKDRHVQLLTTIERIRKENEVQQLSPPPSPPSSHTPDQRDSTAAQEAHQAQLKSLQTAHATAISTLRSSHAESVRKLRSQLTAAEKRESELKSELQALRTSASEQKTQVKTLTAEIEKLESIVAIKEETAAALDLRIAKSVEMREKEWERRVDLLLKERDKMSKALMWAWGEKEVGDSVKDNGDENGKGPRQGYRYKYVVRGAK